MSVYEDIASKTSHRRQREIFRHEKLDEQTEDDDDEDDEDDDPAASITLQVRWESSLCDILPIVS